MSEAKPAGFKNLIIVWFAVLATVLVALVFNYSIIVVGLGVAMLVTTPLRNRWL